jgi:hypothetical protein
MESITAILIVAIIFITFYKVIDLYVRRKERIMMIEKCESLKDASPIFQDFFGGGQSMFKNYSSWSLRIGALFLGIGVGLLVGYAICYYSISSYAVPGKEYDNQIENVISVVYGATTLLFGGMALIFAFLVELKIGKQK